jgi:hypothetical protein
MPASGTARLQPGSGSPAMLGPSRAATSQHATLASGPASRPGKQSAPDD